MLLLEIPDVSGLANLGAVAVIAVFAVREFFAYLSKKSNGNGKHDTVGVKIDLGPITAKLDQLIRASESSPNMAGAKSSDWWELTFSRIIKQCLDDHENRINRPIIEEAAESRQEILQALKSLERQIALAVAEISRQVRDK
jgi:hypothetical protein